jgi:hypothetical protein
VSAFNYAEVLPMLNKPRIAIISPCGRPQIFKPITLFASNSGLNIGSLLGCQTFAPKELTIVVQNLCMSARDNIFNVKRRSLREAPFMAAPRR